jgi:hypothetical protein
MGTGTGDTGGRAACGPTGPDSSMAAAIPSTVQV